MNVSEYLAAVDPHMKRGDSTLFRGQPKSGLSLQPKGFRDPFLDKENPRLRNKQRMSQWEGESMALMDPKTMRNRWDWLTCAQHHGLATQLLDWTNNPLVALYFAVYSDPQDDGEVIIWDTTGVTWILNDNDPDKIDTVVITRPPPFLSRIRMQNGVLSYHPDPTSRLGGETPKRITIPRETKNNLHQVLYRIGYDRGSLYGDLDSLAVRANWVSEILIRGE